MIFFPLARKNKEMAVTDVSYQITAICASAQIVVRQHKLLRELSLKKRSARILLQVSRLIMKKIT